MRITCPACTSSYTIADDKIGAKGRTVRCASCSNKWHVMLEPEDTDDDDIVAFDRAPAPPPQRTIEPDRDPAINANDLFGVEPDEPPVSQARAADAKPATVAAEPARLIDPEMEDATGAGLADAKMPQTEADLARKLAQTAQSADVESLAKKPTIKVTPKKPKKTGKPFKFDMDRVLVRARPIFGGVLLLLSLGVVAITVYLRVPIVSAFPNLAGLYEKIGMPVNLRGLEFQKVEMLREVENGLPVLVVEGELSNPTTSERAVPAIRFALRSDDRQEIYAWSIEPKVSSLSPGANVRFRSRLASPPEQAADVLVRMMDRRNRQAAMP